MSKAKWSEQAFGQKVVEHLTEECWDVYQEVQIYDGGPIADIVATSGPILMVCELKSSMSLALLAQAERWLHWANVVRVFIPRPKKDTSARNFALDVCRDRGIGVTTIDERLGYVDEVVSPALQRKAFTEKLRKVLTEEHKHYAQAGSARGGHWTPFKRTVHRLTELVRAEPGISMKEALNRIEHHYSSYASARSRIVTLTYDGVIDGIKVHREGRNLTLFPTNSLPESK